MTRSMLDMNAVGQTIGSHSALLRRALAAPM